LWLVPGLEVAHQFRAQIPYEVNWRTVLHNRLRMAFLHLSDSRRDRVVKALETYPAFRTALDLVGRSDVTLRRANLLARRKHDDDWFFQRFRLEW
jgi:hypothetical protein